MAINGIVQYTSGFLADILLFTQALILVWFDGTIIDIVVVVFTLKTVLTSIQYPSLSYSSRQRNEFPWSHANPK